ncbi:MAG: hypothetical protein ACM3RX_05205 [Methanococcaceae archaeon]
MPNTNCPTLVSADFNGDNRVDYAAMVHHNEKIELIIFESYKNSYKVIIVEKISYGIYDNGIGLGITLENPGLLQSQEVSVKINNPGIRFVKFESSGSVIYKLKNDYKTFWYDD